MTHLPYIIAAYGFGVMIPGTFAVTAFVRMRTAQRRLAAVDRRRTR
jgi:heme exporter protein D